MILSHRPLPAFPPRRVVQMRSASRRSRRTLRAQLRRWWVVQVIPWWVGQALPWWERHTDPVRAVPALGLLGIVELLIVHFERCA